jgi:hypothetical protein
MGTERKFGADIIGRVKWMALALLFYVGTLSAHHSFSAAFEGSKAIQFKGVVRSVQISNPHSFVFVDVKGGNGKTEMLALEGPSLYGFNRKGLKQDFLKKGDAIDVCGYAVRPGVTTMVEDKVNGGTGKMFSAEQLTLPNGQKLAWADYGTRKCLSAK